MLFKAARKDHQENNHRETCKTPPTLCKSHSFGKGETEERRHRCGFGSATNKQTVAAINSQSPDRRRATNAANYFFFRQNTQSNAPSNINPINNAIALPFFTFVTVRFNTINNTCGSLPRISIACVLHFKKPGSSVGGISQTTGIIFLLSLIAMPIS